MQMYNLLEYTENYSRTSESVWNDHRDEVSDGANEIDAADSNTENNKKLTSRSFQYKTKVIDLLICIWLILK